MHNILFNLFFPLPWIPSPAHACQLGLICTNESICSLPVCSNLSPRPISCSFHRHKYRRSFSLLLHKSLSLKLNFKSCRITLHYMTSLHSCFCPQESTVSCAKCFASAKNKTSEDYFEGVQKYLRSNDQSRGTRQQGKSKHSIISNVIGFDM